MSHLGDRVTDLVDGRLEPDAADRALSHLARCRDCRDAVEAERLTKQRLIALPAPAPGGDLVGRLLAMGGPSGPLPPRPEHVPGTPRVPALPGPGRPVAARLAGARPSSSRPELTRPAGRPAGRRPGRHPGVPASRSGARDAGRRGRVAVAVLGALSAVGVGVGGLLLAAPTGAAVTPPLDSFVVEHAATTADLPFTDVLAGWSTPAGAGSLTGLTALSRRSGAGR